MSEPLDQSARHRFAHELDRNFSVVASAGSGKTWAITERIVQLAQAPGALEILPKLVVVTFTHRAADEMQQRTRRRILETRLPREIQVAFNRAFFGTIHSFCMKLLGTHGHYLGLPTPLDLVTDDEDLWEEFVQQKTTLGRNLSEENRAELFRLTQARQLMELGRNARGVLAPAGEIGPCPQVESTQVHAVVAKGSAIENITDSKAELAEWEERYYRAGWEYVRWPNRKTKAKDFVQRWTDAFAPLRTWVTEAASCVAAEVQQDYRDFRIERGVVTYGDQIALADELLQHPTASRRVREENFRVILDEAQDTDPAQFSVLTEITRPPDAPGRWLQTQVAPPRPGHFCMVGDFQQSIYRDRADLNNYRAIHRALLQDGTAAALEFSVTFRLDQNQLDFVNRTFSQILNRKDGQVAFVELQPRPEVLAGQVVRLSLGKDLLGGETKQRDYQKAKLEADNLAQWIKETGFEKLRARAWRDVAILCPRKLWLRTMATSLRRSGIPVSIHSESDLKGDNPAHAWLTALCTIMANPRNSYEVVGVLREVFGISDHDLAVFSEGDGRRFRIDEATASAGKVSSPLRLLAETRTEMEGRPLFDALNILLEKTRLRERLASLPPEDFTNLESELDALLALAAEVEANRATLADFAARLRADFTLQRDVRISDDDGIQLITAQKAKGSEWQAVILPFLGRGIMTPSPRYPCLIKVPGSTEPLVALDKDDFFEEEREATKVAVRQEMARLLYVACTRARHTLILVDDHELFATAQDKTQPTAQITHFETNVPEHAAIFEELAATAEFCEQTAAAISKARDEEEALPPILPTIDRKADARAATRANDFVHRFNPSAYDEALAEALSADLGSANGSRADARSIPDTPATLYGRWWHTLFEQFPWKNNGQDAEAIFQRHQQISPDPARSAAEWNLVATQMRGETVLTRYLTRPNTRAQAEYPFAWSIGPRACVEGIIDLLLIDSDDRKGLLLDWKTNRISRRGEADLRRHYRPQLAAYWKAVSEITGFEVQAGLYSTALGKLLIYEESELTHEWERLATLSSAELRSEIAPEEI